MDLVRFLKVLVFTERHRMNAPMTTAIAILPTAIPAFTPTDRLEPDALGTRVFEAVGLCTVALVELVEDGEVGLEVKLSERGEDKELVEDEDSVDSTS